MRLSFAHFEDTLAHIEQGDEKVLLSKMLRDMRVEEPEIRKDIILKLSKHAYKDLFISHIMEAMERDSDMDVRETAAEVLCKFDNKETVSSFIEALSDKSPGVRKIAVDALEKIGNEGHIEYIIKLVSDTNPDVRKSATRAIARLGHKKVMNTITPLGRVVKDMDLKTATMGLKNVQEAAKGFLSKFLKKKEE
ncbi:MAG: putative lyase [bacterium ADurb.Bin363]|nr:MAG: putative lyase [bacterium ADurb.Bin363]